MEERRRGLLSGNGLLTFSVTYNGTIYEYSFAKGMTWAEFIASAFNDGSFIVNGTIVCYTANNIEIRLNQTTALVSDLISEESYNAFVWATTNKYIYQTGKTSLSYGTASGNGYDIKSDRIKMSVYRGNSYAPVTMYISNIDVSSYKQLVVEAEVGNVNSYTDYYFRVSGSSSVDMTGYSKKKYYSNITNLYGNKTITFYCDNYDENDGSYSAVGINIYNIYLSP